MTCHISNLYIAYGNNNCYFNFIIINCLNLHLLLLLILSISFDKCVKGGESVYLNAVHVAKQFRQNYPEYFKTLSEIKAIFQRIHYERERPVHMVVKRKHIVLNEHDEVSAY